MAAHSITVAPVREQIRSVAVLPVRRFYPRRYRPGGDGQWSGHLPFAHDLVAALQPGVFVELGTHRGESYFGFCQALVENAVDCVCYAVDTWKGDIHAGFYGEGIFQDVREYNRAHYAGFSTLLRSSFDDANAQFADSSIDLLHIDGLHTYDAVKRDFELWLPKVRPGGVILFHDINVHQAEFGVWKLWEELQSQGQSFEFSHAWGLGVLRVPGSSEPPPELLATLFHCTQEDRRAIREHYALAADYLELTWRLESGASVETRKAFLQVFGDRTGVFLESGSARAELEPGVWRDYVVELAYGADAPELRLDLADCPCVIELSAIAVRSADDHTLLFRYTGKAELDACTCAGDLMPLPTAARARFLSYGTDPQLLVRAPEGVRLNQPLVVEVSMRIIPGLEDAAADRKTAPEKITDIETAHIERTLALNRVETMRAELRHEQTERITLVAELTRAGSERDALASAHEAVQASVAHEQALRATLEQELATIRLAAAQRESERSALEQQRAERVSEVALLRAELARVEAELARRDALPALPPVIDLEAVRVANELRLGLEASLAEERERRSGLSEQCTLLRADLSRLESELSHARARTAELTDDRAYLEARLHDEKALCLSLSKEHDLSRQRWERDLSALHEAIERLQIEPVDTAGMEKILAATLAEHEARAAQERLASNARLNEIERRHAASLRAESERWQAALAAERTGREELLHSLSWRATAPLRAIFGLIRPSR